MQLQNDAFHIASIEIKARAIDAFAFMADARNISQWALGAWTPLEATETSYCGASLFDGGLCYIRLEADSQTQVVHFRTGASWAALTKLIICRIKENDGNAATTPSCFLSLEAERPADMSSSRWQQLKAAHEAEIFIVKNRVEMLPASANPQRPAKPGA